MSDEAAPVRLPALFRRRPNAVFEQAAREGVCVVVAATGDLAEDELLGLLRFRLAQYVAVGLADPAAIAAAGLEHEPLSAVAATDLHVIAGAAADGELLCYMAVRGVEPPLPGIRMRSRLRPPFPVEETHGVGIFDRVPILADLPAAKVRELGRFVKEHRRHAADELGARASVETVLALARSLAGPLRASVDALVGEVEAGVAKRNLDFFDFPTIDVGGTIPFDEQSSYLQGHDRRDFYPFAGLISDLAEHTVPRADAIEAALELPGRQGVRALLGLKRTAAPPRSRLEPPGGLPPLTADRVAQAHLSLERRRELRAAGDALRSVPPFDGLSVAEATVLRTFMRRRAVPAGEQIIRHGADDRTLFVLEDGTVEVRRDGMPLRRLQALACFGEIAPAFGLRRTADVFAVTPVSVLELPLDAYSRYVETLPDVERELVAVGGARLAQ